MHYWKYRHFFNIPILTRISQSYRYSLKDLRLKNIHKNPLPSYGLILRIIILCQYSGNASFDDHYPYNLFILSKDYRTNFTTR